MDDPEQPTHGNEVESERDRHLANVVLLLFFLVIVGGGIWLANAMFEQRTIEDCLAQGRRNCAPIDAPSR